jgi:hypothetical protein
MQEHANTVVSPEELASVTSLERLRAILAMAHIGNADKGEHSAAAVKAAAAAFRSGEAFKGTVFSDDVSHLVPGSDGVMQDV